MDGCVPVSANGDTGDLPATAFVFGALFEILQLPKSATKAITRHDLNEQR